MDRAHAGPETVNGRPTTLHGSERTRILGQKQQVAWKKFGNPVFGLASNLAVVHEIILGGVHATIHMHRPAGRIAEAVSHGQMPSRIQKHVRLDPQ